jgi:hypothetical protein
MGDALKLGSLTPEQRTAIEQLVAQRRAAGVPVRQADAQVLTVLAHQVEQASFDAQALAPSLGAEQAAAVAQSNVERDTLNRLHALLTPAQRGELVDMVGTAGPHGKHERGAKDDHERGERGAKLGLTPEQKAKIHASLEADRAADAAAPQKGQWKAALESFRNASFDAGTMVRVERRGEQAARLAKAMAPVLTPNQRATVATELRARAAHETSH